MINLFQVLFLVLSTIIITVAPTNIIDQTCAQIVKLDPLIVHDFCVSTLKSDPRSDNANLTTLFQISLDMVQHNASGVIPIINGYFDDPKITGESKGALSDCLAEYSRVSDAITSALNYFNAKDLEGANVAISGVSGGTNICDTSFKQYNLTPLLSKQDDDLFNLADIALGILELFRS
ncbi:hypothetical protein RND81_05G086700 [Saponaria officinalis]|uniref:Pectinesterase inhibitor domain-containing protein n=1 Tax=Saponaria officinalis TaxID=3572 RepID=A0AAW1KVG1_SAPOF